MVGDGGGDLARNLLSRAFPYPTPESSPALRALAPGVGIGCNVKRPSQLKSNSSQTLLLAHRRRGC